MHYTSFIMYIKWIIILLQYSIAEIDEMTPFGLVNSPHVKEGHKWSIQVVSLDDTDTIEDIRISEWVINTWSQLAALIHFLQSW